MLYVVNFNSQPFKNHLCVHVANSPLVNIKSNMGMEEQMFDTSMLKQPKVVSEFRHFYIPKKTFENQVIGVAS